MKFSRRHANEIALFRSLPEDQSTMESRHTLGVVMPMDSLVEVFFEKHQIGQLNPQQRIIEAWDDILGKDADRCRPERLDSTGQLVVSVPNGVLRNQLRFRTKTILAAIQKLPDCSGVKKIHWIG
jgi:hypothetical protein